MRATSDMGFGGPTGSEGSAFCIVRNGESAIADPTNDERPHHSRHGTPWTLRSWQIATMGELAV